MSNKQPIIAVCGKGGAGKTALTALLAKSLLASGIKPLLLIDADPAGGLVLAIDEKAGRTLAGVREEVIRSAREADDRQRLQLANRVDYLLLEALIERKDYSLLAMGRNSDKGCFCPVNTLLREAIDQLAAPFAVVLIDAEAGLEQINRRVTRSVTKVLAVTDGSVRGNHTVDQIAELVSPEIIGVVINRVETSDQSSFENKLELLGEIPEDPELKRLDRAGESLWTISEKSAALLAVNAIAGRLNLKVNN